MISKIHRITTFSLLQMSRFLCIFARKIDCMNKQFEEFLGFSPVGITKEQSCSHVQLQRFLEALDRVSDENFYVIDLARQNIFYMSDKLEALLQAHNKSKSLTDRFLKSTTLADRELQKHILSLLPEIYKELPVSERNSIVLSGTYQLFNEEQRLLVFERDTPIFVDEEGDMQFLLCTLTGASTQTPHEMIISKGVGADKEYYSLKDRLWYKSSEDGLSNRERMVLNLAGQGASTEAMAKEIGVSVDTIKKCRKDLMKKLGVMNITQAVKKASNLKMT